MAYRAMNHVMTHTRVFQRPEFGRYHLGRVVGPGVLVTEGGLYATQSKMYAYQQVEDQHRNQVRYSYSSYSGTFLMVVVSETCHEPSIWTGTDPRAYGNLYTEI